MYIEINDTTTFREIEEVFAAYYPWLRLAFYRTEHQPFEASPEQEALSPGLRVGDFRKTHVTCLLYINPLEQVQQLEKELQQLFSLPAQVLYKEKNAWVQSTGMDTFTLKELNELSRNASDDELVRDYEEGFEASDIKPTALL